MNHTKTVVVIAGPTASGKTEMAIRLAQGLGTEIISADSRQCYRELSIGVARPTPEELASVPHHFIASHSIHDAVTGATFEAFALQKTFELFETHDYVVMVGGTGLYLDAFCYGLDPIPPIPEATRQALRKKYEAEGLAWLQSEVALADPRFWSEGEIHNPHRLLRALEVITTTGTSIQDFKRQRAQTRPFNILRFALGLSKEDLHARIARRVDAMMTEGLGHEARTLLPARHLPALQTVGYKELFAHFDGVIDLRTAVEDIKLHTRQYAKRQLTWFKKDLNYQWIEAGNHALLASAVRSGGAAAK